MKSMRYIVTRPCLQEGTLSILKYLQATFPQSGPAIFVDDRGDEHSVQVDTERARIWGLGGLYHAQHLGVNDVLIVTNLAPARYQVEAIVKPHAPPPLPRRSQDRAPETRRVVVASTAHVREVRMLEIPPSQKLDAHAAQETEATPQDGNHEVRVTEVRTGAAETAGQGQPEKSRAEHSRTEAAGTEKNAERNPGEQTRADWTGGRHGLPAAEQPAAPSRLSFASTATEQTSRTEQGSNTPVVSAAAPLPRAPLLSSSAAQLQLPDAQLAELARLTGYQLDNLGGGVLRLKADLGAHSYAVVAALDEQARSAPAWNEEMGYRVMLCGEDQHPEGVARLTHEALAALIEHARLAPLSPVDLRGYWKAGHVDLESAASIAELVSAHLAQRGIFSFVLLTLAQQPAHSVISVPRLAEKLGSGVNYAELGSILETLTRTPFLALTPLPGGQFLLRAGVTDILTDLAEYADGIRRRVRTPATAVGGRTAAGVREGIRA